MNALIVADCATRQAFAAVPVRVVGIVAPADAHDAARELGADLLLIAKRPRVLSLTRREREVLALVAEGLSNRAIADRLGVRERTVKFHASNVYGKLGVRNRTAASRYAHGA
jgi:DNA-binding NarL/FixJ family response regulator